MRRGKRQSQHSDAWRFAFIMRLEFETAEPLNLQARPVFSKPTLFWEDGRGQRRDFAAQGSAPMFQ